MSKTDILKSNGTYNINSASVRAENFQHGIFFDPCDLIQVKYEMLRCVERKELSISEATKRYGFSRQTYYSLKAAVEEGGIMALIPQKTGPKNNFKLIEEGQLFIDAYLRKHPEANSHEINAALEESTGIAVHDRTVDRYISKKWHGSR